MTLSLTIIQISLIFLPGIIWSAIDAKFVAKRERSQFQITLNAFLFGVTSYALTFLAYALFNKPFGIVEDVSLDQGVAGMVVLADEIVAAVGVAFISSILWLYGSTYKVFTHFLQMIKATSKYGDEDVWDYIFNSGSASTEYVNIRDFDKKIVYAGYPRTFSETGRLREVLLRDAQIYDFDGNKLFEMPYIYLARKPDDIHLEFPYGPDGPNL